MLKHINRPRKKIMQIHFNSTQLNDLTLPVVGRRRDTVRLNCLAFDGNSDTGGDVRFKKVEPVPQISETVYSLVK